MAEGANPFEEPLDKRLTPRPNPDKIQMLKLKAMLESALENYTDKAPSLQNAIDIFSGEWSSRVPDAINTGAADLFADPRVEYWISQTRSYFNGKKIGQLVALELGPLEGAHSLMFEHAGWQVTSIESNYRAFLKTLIVYNHFRLRAVAMYGDFNPYLALAETPIFDFISASGVLYHMKNPILSIDLILNKCNSVGIWTHFVTEDFMASSPGRWHREAIQIGNNSYTGYKQYYGEGLGSNRFCGGGQDYAIWLTQDQIIERLSINGFKTHVGNVILDHPNGPCITLHASRIL